ncbi:hypothetical protein Bra1253DRAFT_00134, partial [Bradyrhizobium sp. WSM1253]
RPKTARPWRKVIFFLGPYRSKSSLSCSSRAVWLRRSKWYPGETERSGRP